LRPRPGHQYHQYRKVRGGSTDHVRTAYRCKGIQYRGAQGRPSWRFIEDGIDAEGVSFQPLKVRIANSNRGTSRIELNSTRIKQTVTPSYCKQFSYICKAHLSILHPVQNTKDIFTRPQFRDGVNSREDGRRHNLQVP